MQSRTLTASVLAALALTAGCGGSDTGPLSPARNLAGTWKMDVPVTVYFDTDFCTPAPSLVASQAWNATWVITPGLDDNTVYIQMTFSTSNSQILHGCPGTGVVPEVSPMFLTGNVSAATLTVRNGNDPVGTFTFTDWNLQGDFDYSFCLLYCQREYTQNRSFILRKQ
ncbi:MAG TPA: hypothetical protein VFM53_01005 [Anaeromyxobacteraceae bacterium]|nr:hypothetical protein [Anaeromyxobacteraceae bacterium]